MGDTEHLYRMNYRLIPRPEGFNKTEAMRLANQDESMGSCDAVLMASIIRNPDGSSSTGIFSADGDNDGKELTAIEQFKVWTLMAHHLSNNPELGEGHRMVCAETFEIIRAAVLGSRPPVH